jgi:hypothetical protein
VALSNSKVFPGKFVACFAIALVGDRFTDREDQERLRELWYACERSHGFPPTATVRTLNQLNITTYTDQSPRVDQIHQLEDSWGWHHR